MAIPREAVRWEVAGVPFVFVAGSLLHFAYDWFSRSFWMAPVAAIDESVWEHLKLAFWPAAAFAVVQAAAMRSGVRNYVLGKAVGLSVAPLAIVAGFYGYTAILGHHALAADLALFVAAVTLGAAASLAVYALPDFGAPGRRAGFAAIIVWIASFASFTYNKPPFGLFQVDDESSNHEAVNGPRIGHGRRPAEHLRRPREAPQRRPPRLRERRVRSHTCGKRVLLSLPGTFEGPTRFVALSGVNPRSATHEADFPHATFQHSSADCGGSRLGQAARGQG